MVDEPLASAGYEMRAESKVSGLGRLCLSREEAGGAVIDGHVPEGDTQGGGCSAGNRGQSEACRSQTKKRAF
eukprot:XP_001709829.1 Hypothetical protein GL50803_88219 [Giardia lamblia ATCC 50803]